MSATYPAVIVVLDLMIVIFSGSSDHEPPHHAVSSNRPILPIRFSISLSTWFSKVLSPIASVMGTKLNTHTTRAGKIVVSVFR